MHLGTRLGSGRHDCLPLQRSHSGKDEYKYRIMSGFNSELFNILLVSWKGFDGGANYHTLL